MNKHKNGNARGWEMTEQGGKYRVTLGSGIGVVTGKTRELLTKMSVN
jgi:hypothetical protein